MKTKCSTYVLSLTFLVGLCFSHLASAQTEKVLHVFTGGRDGGYPYSGALIRDTLGNLYGTTQEYGIQPCPASYYGCGTVFELRRSGHGWKFEVLYRFHGRSDGAQPGGSLLFGSDGNLYGTTSYAEVPQRGGYGTVFELEHTAHGWKEKTLYAFKNCPDGAEPVAGLAMDGSGNLYGTTLAGGDQNCIYGAGCGVVFELEQSGGGWKEKVLHRFHGDEGASPFAAITLASPPHSDGLTACCSIYGTTEHGGYPSSYDETAGVVFGMVRTGNQWRYKVLYKFPVNDGNPDGTLLFSKGNLYGTAVHGGNYGLGNVFELSPSDDQGKHWTGADLYDFFGSNGMIADAGVVMDNSGELWGTTWDGGTNNTCSGGCGIVYRLSKNGGSWSESLLQNFPGGTEGFYAFGGVLLGPAGHLYGTTYDGGDPTCQCGVVYEISP